MKRTLFSFLAAGLISFSGLAQQDIAFEDIYQLIYKNSFFNARDVYSATKNNLAPEHQMFIEAVLYNAFGRLTESNEKIAELQNKLDQFPDSLQVALYSIKADNFVKLFEYKEAKIATEFILENYGNILSKEEANNYRNNLVIWTALENQPKQLITINDNTKIKIKVDRFGGKNLPVTINSDSFDFIFDTGANFSAIVRSLAEKYNMDILPDSIEVGGVGPNKVFAQIAVCPEFYLGNIKIQNAVFLVFDDKDLTFSPFRFFLKFFFKIKCLGIIGYPIIAALKEVQITRDGYFIVPETETVFAGSNMAMAGLTPLISIEGNPYIFDTGSNTTTFFKPYYLANKDEIESKYRIRRIRYGGVGGNVRTRGYIIDVKLNVQDRDIFLRRRALLLEEEPYTKGIWGYIGMDVIRQFEKYTLNFNKMFINFE
jgi:hypothetical protein